jgi:long-chain acyl-CoA synthetase
VAIDAARDVAVFQYTGGTTGTSKGAMLTHLNLVANCLQTKAWSPQLRDGEEVTVAVLPFFHIYGLTVVLNMSVVVGGATLVVLPRFDPAEVLATVQRTRATVLPMVPSMFVGLNAAMGAAEARGERVDLSSLRLANAGGAAMPPEVAREFTRCTGLLVHEGYGLSEASPVTHFNPGWMPPREGSIGLPIPDVDSKIVDADGRALGPGLVGELCVRGPNVMVGYWNRPDETARALRADPVEGDAPHGQSPDGPFPHGGRGPWLHTGDLARMDPDGYVAIVDRAKDMILVGGYNVYPREIEEVLYEHPAVQEVAAYGVPDAYLGEVARAAVVLRPGASATPDALVAHCRERLAPYKAPRTVEVRDALPKSTVGKLLRRVLRDEAATRATADPST